MDPDLIIRLYCGGLMASKEAEGWTINAEEDSRVTKI
jgi:hypothetical protein